MARAGEYDRDSRAFFGHDNSGTAAPNCSGFRAMDRSGDWPHPDTLKVSALLQAGEACEAGTFIALQAFVPWSSALNPCYFAYGTTLRSPDNSA